jgi:hypothetical protein
MPLSPHCQWTQVQWRVAVELRASNGGTALFAGSLPLTVKFRRAQIQVGCGWAVNEFR